MRKYVLCLVALVVLPVTAAQSDQAVPPGYGVQASNDLMPGVTHSVVSRLDPPVEAHVARLAPGAAADLRVVSARDRIPRHGSDLELPSSMCRRTDCLVGINGDFHHLVTDMPLGGVITGGRMLRSPVPSHDQLVVSPTPSAGNLGWEGALITSDSNQLRIDSVNTGRDPGTLALVTDSWGGSTGLSGDGFEVILAPVAGVPGTLNTDVTMTVVGSDDDGDAAVPPGGAVLAGDGEPGARLRDLHTRMQAGHLTPQVRIRINSATPVTESLGGNPIILRNGQAAYPNNNDGFTRFRHPRTLFGWNAAGERFLVVVDGRRDASRGVDMADAAALLLGLGATEGIALDGGGGSTFVVHGQVVNQPSDGESQSERAAPNALVVVARPDAVVYPPEPVAPTPTTAPPAVVVPAPTDQPVGAHSSSGEPDGSDQAPVNPEEPSTATPSTTAGRPGPGGDDGDGDDGDTAGDDRKPKRKDGERGRTRDKGRPDAMSPSGLEPLPIYDLDRDRDDDGDGGGLGEHAIPETPAGFGSSDGRRGAVTTAALLVLLNASLVALVRAKRGLAGVPLGPSVPLGSVPGLPRNSSPPLDRPEAWGGWAGDELTDQPSTRGGDPPPRS